MKLRSQFVLNIDGVVRLSTENKVFIFLFTSYKYFLERSLKYEFYDLINYIFENKPRINSGMCFNLAQRVSSNVFYYACHWVFRAINSRYNCNFLSERWNAVKSGVVPWLDRWLCNRFRLFCSHNRLALAALIIVRTG